MDKKQFTPEITSFIDSPDVIEKVQRQIAYILKGETSNQYILAGYYKLIDKSIYNMRIYVENARPYDFENDPPKTPFVNILLSKTSSSSNARMGQQKMKAVFFIDCIAFGNDAGEGWDKKAAAVRAWKAARIVRRIVMSDQYVYLGMRGTVGSRNVVSMEAAVPENGGDAVTTVLVRITLEIEYLECAESTIGEILEGIDFDIDMSNGEVLKTNYRKEA